jgi:selenocysteine lyase/cysteine desulfurase
MLTQMVAAPADSTLFADWRRTELARFDSAGVTYLDYTGAALYPDSLVRGDTSRLLGAVLGNPHSEHVASRQSTSDLDAARAAILAFLGANAEEYEVVLTANATAACRLVGESFPFSPNAPFLFTVDNHNSVNGIREFAAAKGARAIPLPLDAELRLRDPVGVLGRESGTGLFALPAQSNFSGVRHPLSLVHDAQRRGHRVLLDAASFLHSGRIDFASVQPDFIALSIYKIAGYPTGIGALVARRDSLAELQRPWFAGGTVDWVITTPPRHQLRADSARFEDGTPPFLAAGAVPAALSAVAKVGGERLSRYLDELTATLLDGLTQLRHANGRPRVAIHGPLTTRERGATVALSALDPDGEAVPFWEVESAAREAGLALRGGCFCNPGCAQHALQLPVERMELCATALGESFTVPRLAAALGTNAVGAIRISLGLGSTAADIDRALRFFSAERVP